MLVVSLVLLVVAAAAVVILGVRIRRLAGALAAAQLAAAQAATQAAQEAGRADAAEGRVAVVEGELAQGSTRLADAEAALEAARADTATVRARLEAAEVDARRVHTLARGAEAEAEAARRRARAAEEAAVGHPGWVEVLSGLELVRAARTWRSVAPMDEAPGEGHPDADALGRGLEVELQWLRDVVGTPGQLATMDGHDPGAAAGPAGLVALLVAQEVLDVVGKRVEALDVAYARTEGDVRLAVSSPEAEHPVDPDGRLQRVAAMLAPLGGVLLIEVGDDPGVVVRLVVPVAHSA